ncbi:activator-dependent family glycosyltransferase [Herbidospora yilanensis]|uniref:activator-dependent family glycosyltransferase n=1 Tax=Herbidospora yilanensis TaxID=354426 RepID=UPI0007851A82|nr:activator-dependent family glycosyltransferase [Herbidospora yilanensis]
MRVLFTTYPEKAHFLAMAPLAWALRTAGHEVVFAVQPSFCPVVTQAGLTAVPIGGDRDLWQLMNRDLNWIAAGTNGLPVPYDAAEWRPRDVTWTYLRDGYAVQVPRWHKMSNVPMVPALVDFARHWKPDLVIWEPTTYAGAIAARACGAAHARLLFSVDGFGVTREHYLRLKPAESGDDPLAEWLDGYARAYGFPYGEDLTTGDFTITLVPPSMRLEADGLRYVPLRYVPYGGPAVVPGWLRAAPERPRVAFTTGISFAEHGAGSAVSLRDVLGTLAGLDVELVATVGDAERERLGGVLPGNVRLVRFVPMQALVATCSVVIHHAGFGTLATTALQGVPQLAMPFDGDGPALARRIAAQGAGLALLAAQVSGPTIRDRLLRLLREPAFGVAAARLRQEMLDMPSPNELAGDLAELAGR